MNKKKEANELGIGVFNSGKDVDQYTIDDELIKKALSLIEEGNEEYSFPTS